MMQREGAPLNAGATWRYFSDWFIGHNKIVWYQDTN